MEPGICYTVFKLGTTQLHQLHTSQGRVFIAGEVAAALFGQSPTAFLQDLRQGKYQKLVLTDPAALEAVAALGLPVESSAGGGGSAALPPAAVQQLMEAARLMARGEYDAALLVALDAGEGLFRPGPALQMFPLYLLAAQANLGLRRVQQCSDALRLAGLLALKEPGLTTGLMRSQLARLNGQLAALQGRAQAALSCFAEDVYYCSLEYGPRDVRTSLGYFNIGKDPQGALACGDVVVAIWQAALAPLVLGAAGAAGGGGGAAGAPQAAAARPLGPLQAPGAAAALPVGPLPVGPLQLLEVADLLLDVARLRERAGCDGGGGGGGGAGGARVVAAMALVHCGEGTRALELLEEADPQLPLADAPARALLDGARAAAEAAAARGPGACGGGGRRASWQGRSLGASSLMGRSSGGGGGVGGAAVAVR
ncbi:MAG: subunit of axonemal inner dynein [Monoraphidium minutum]|nr:MAG: subunit of axonemal inner dynein [Monoraphidium minutum]